MSTNAGAHDPSVRFADTCTFLKRSSRKGRGTGGVERSGTPSVPRRGNRRILAGPSQSVGSTRRHLVIGSPGEDMCPDGLAAIDAQWGVRAVTPEA